MSSLCMSRVCMSRWLGFRNPALVAWIVLVVGLGATGQATADMWYVDARTGHDALGTGTVESPWKTISFALRRLPSSIPPGGITIQVGPGYYNRGHGETFPLTLPSRVRLMGAGPEQTIVAGTGAVGEILVAFLPSEDVGPTTTLEGMTFLGSETGLYVRGVHYRMSPTIHRCRFLGMSLDGIRLRAEGTNTEFAPVFGNVIVDQNAGKGIRIEAYFGARVAIELRNLTVVSNASGGVFSSASANGTDQILLDHCIVWENGLADLEGIQAGSVSYCNFDVAIGAPPPRPGDHGNCRADPGFVNSSGGDYHLLPHSSMLDQGRPLDAENPCWFEHDYDGEDRYTDARALAWGHQDIGADEYATLRAQTRACLGQTLVFDLTVPGAPGMGYAMAASFSRTPGLSLPPPDRRIIPLAQDDLFWLSVWTGLPLFDGFHGFLDIHGAGSACVAIPQDPLGTLIGVNVHFAFLTLNRNRGCIPTVSNGLIMKIYP